MNNKTELAISELAKSLNREKSVVLQDLKYIKSLKQDLKKAFNKFFILGDGWLKHPLNEFQSGVVDRLCMNIPWQGEILPRFHTKTLLVARIDVALRAMLGMEKYQVVISLTEDNYVGNLEAIMNIAQDSQFRGIQWLANYIHGPKIVKKRGNILYFGNGSIIEFRSLLGEMRGLNKANAGGRPSRVILDDIIPTEAAWSETIRSRIIDRYLSMVVPLGKDGSKVIVVGTIMHRDDLVNMIATGKIGGYTVTPPEHRAAYNEMTHEVLFKERWTYEDIMKLKREQYDAVGKSHLFRREILNDPSESDTHPFSGMPAQRFTKASILPSRLYRVVGVDHAHGMGRDFFVIAEYGMDFDGNVFNLCIRRDQNWDINRRMAELIGVLKYRTPHMLVIQDTTESKSFIEVVTAKFKQANIHVPITTPHPNGSKNMHILNWIQPRLLDKSLLFPEGELWGDWFDAEASNFDLTKKDNVDDLLDVTSTIIQELQPPTRNQEVQKMFATDPLSAMIIDTIKGSEQQEARNRQFRRWRR